MKMKQSVFKNIACDRSKSAMESAPTRNGECPNSQCKQKRHSYRKPSEIRKTANENEKSCIQKMACARSKSANVEGAPFP